MFDMLSTVYAKEIQQVIWWDPKGRYHIGKVDYYMAVPEANNKLAMEVLVFMVSCITGHWKYPTAYFIQNNISASVQTQLIKDFIGLLVGEGLNAVALFLMVHLLIKAHQHGMEPNCFMRSLNLVPSSTDL